MVSYYSSTLKWHGVKVGPGPREPEDPPPPKFKSGTRALPKV